jgi:hypothetical protein
MILRPKFTKKAPDSMNFVNFAGKRPCFQRRRVLGNRLGTGAAGRFRPVAVVPIRRQSACMKRLSLIVAAAAALAPGAARSEIDTTADAIRMLHSQAACMVYRAPEASRIVALPPGSRAERELLRDLQAGCIGGPYGLDAQRQLQRGAIVEEVLRRGDKNRLDGRTIRWVAPFAALGEAEIAALHPQGRSALAALDLAQCVYAAAPEKVRALLETAPSYPTEQKAFASLSPFLGPCLRQGAQVTFSLPRLRGALAEATYRALYAAGRRSM